MHRFEILLKINDLQIKSNNIFFNKGLFPSYRTNKLLGISHPDDNIFSSASTLYILKSLSPKLTQKELSLVKDMENNLHPNFKKYHHHQRNSYNFWQKSKGKHFPNGFVFHRLDKFKLPDDIDTTSMVHMLCDIPKKEALKTKKSLQNHANNTNLSIKNGHTHLQHLNAYSTWFGKKMPIEFDVCVLCNTLLWIHHYNFELNDWDHATIKVVEETIKQSLYFKSPFKSAPEYPKLEIILYHLSRVAAQTPYLNLVRNKLIDDLLCVYEKCTSNFDKMLIQSSLLKLGNRTYTNTPSKIPFETRDYWWFTAGMLSVYSNPIIQTIAPNKLFHFRFTCTALNLALVFENLVLVNS